VSPAALPLTELFLSLAACAGLLVLQRLVAAQGAWQPLNRRFLFGLRVALLIYAGRAFMVLTGLEAFGFLVLLGAALVPLAVVLLAEGLVRRHAPVWVKTLVAIGTVAFGLSAFWVSGSIDPARLIALLIYQISGLFIAGWLVLRRDKASLSAAENQQAERLVLSLILLLPFAASDFLLNYIGLPVRPSAIGVLFLCWLAISLGQEQGGHRATIARFVVLLTGTGLAGLLIAQLAGLSLSETILSLAIIWAAALVATLWNDARALREQVTRQSLLALLAETHGDKADLLARLQSHPMVGGALQLGASELVDLDKDVLAELFARQPVLTRAHAAEFPESPGEHARHLFLRFDASHILLTGNEPLTLLALSLPEIGATGRAELELVLVQRMAVLLGRAS